MNYSENGNISIEMQFCSAAHAFAQTSGKTACHIQTGENTMTKGPRQLDIVFHAHSRVYTYKQQKAIAHLQNGVAASREGGNGALQLSF